MKLTEHKYDFEKKIVPSLNAIKSFKIEKSYKAIVPRISNRWYCTL